MTVGQSRMSPSLLTAVRQEIWEQHLVVTHQAKQPMHDGWGFARAEAILALVEREYTLIPKHAQAGESIPLEDA